jgi:molybdate transport system substrate-binding protein
MTTVDHACPPLCPPRWRRGFLALALAALAAIPLPTTALAGEPVIVFAAASMTDALNGLIREFSADEHDAIRLSYASSSILARQIEAGAPADIFIAANEQWMDYLAERDLIQPGSRTSPVANKLVLIAPANSKAALATRSMPPVVTPALLQQYLGKDGRLALGDPAHVPAGIYGKQSLESIGLWPTLEARLAPTDNVRAALALVERGETPLGITYATDALISHKVKIVGVFAADSHDPISYPFALVKPPEGQAVKPDAEALLRFLNSPEALKHFEALGFAANGGS